MKFRLLVSFFFVVIATSMLFPGALVFAGSVLEAYKYAWSDQVGYINFENVIVDNDTLSGYAWSANEGWIKFNPEQGGVMNNGVGGLSGYAWGSQLGWINFGGVTINPSTGKFSGTATGSLIGTLTFDCSYCDVRTDWTYTVARGTGSRSNNRSPSIPPTESSSPEIPEEPSVTSPSEALIVPPDSTQETSEEPAVTIREEVVEESSHIETVNEPLAIQPEQSGTYRQDTVAGEVILTVPSLSVESRTIFTILEIPIETVDRQLIADWIELVNLVIFDVSAKDESGNAVTSFLKPITITLPIPERLVDAKNLGVYSLNETNRRWALIPDALFSGDRVSFTVNHLTKFAILQRKDGLSPESTIPFPKNISESRFPYFFGLIPLALTVLGIAKIFWLMRKKQKKSS